MSLENNPNDKINIGEIVESLNLSAAKKSRHSRRLSKEPRDAVMEEHLKYTIQDLQLQIVKMITDHPDILQRVNVSILSNPSKMSMPALIALKHQVEAAIQIVHAEHDEEHNEKSLFKSIAGFFEGKPAAKAANPPLVTLNSTPSSISLEELGNLQTVNLRNAMKMVDTPKLITNNLA